MVTEKPHIVETVITSKVPVPIINRPRFAMDGEQPKYIDEERVHLNRHYGEEERELGRVKKEAEKQMEIARTEVGEEARKQEEKDAKERRIRREARRKGK
jgi:hypothetical protein